MSDMQFCGALVRAIKAESDWELVFSIGKENFADQVGASAS
jgi:hypothetical protein